MTQILEEAPWRGEVSAALGFGDPVQFIVRVGYAKAYPQPVSLRMPFARIVAGQPGRS